jgi:hypothetical protein
MRRRENRESCLSEDLRDRTRIELHKRVAILKLVAAYRQLGVEEIARGVWPGCAPKTAERRAERGVAQLVAAGHLLQMENAYSSSSLILSPRGAASLRLDGFECRHGVRLDLGGHQFFRRWLVAQYLIDRSIQGRGARHKCWLMTGRPPIRRSELTERLGLPPDGIVLMPKLESSSMRKYTLDWVRVVSSRVPARELDRMSSVASHSGSWIDSFHSVQLDRVVLVCTADHGRITNTLRQYLLAHLQPGGTPLNIVLVRCRTDIPLKWRGYEEIDAQRLLAADQCASPSTSP